MFLFIDQRSPPIPDLRLYLPVKWAVHINVDVNIHVRGIIADK